MRLTLDEQIEAVDRADWRSSKNTGAYPGITEVIPDSRWLRALHAEGFEIVRTPSTEPACSAHGEPNCTADICEAQPTDPHTSHGNGSQA